MASPLSSQPAAISQQGIDIQQALSILSTRSEPGNDDHDHVNGCGCGGGSGIPEGAKEMGQTLDMLASTSPPVPSTGGGESVELTEEEQAEAKERLRKERDERQRKIRKELESMSNTELLQAVLKSQEDRVATYKEYENGLNVVLQTMNMTAYPDACSKATASFSVLSETIKMIQEILASPTRKRADLTKLVAGLQANEKEKLHLTAAYHLERIRQQNQSVQPDSDPRITKLLNEGAKALQQKIQARVETINEVIDEIRCAIVDEE